MEYTCLKNVQKGFITTRKPEQVESELLVRFSGAPPNAHAIFENGNGDSLYRLLEDESCSVPAHYLVGEVKSTITVLDGKSNAKKCYCEPFFAERVGGVLLVYPNWLDIPMQIISVYEALNDVKNDVSILSNKCTTLDKKVDKVLDGVDFD